MPVSRRLDFLSNKCCKQRHTSEEDAASEMLLDGPTVSATRPPITLRSSQFEVTATRIRWLLHRVRRRRLVTGDRPPGEYFQ